MSPIEVSVCAEGALPSGEAEELAALGLLERVEQVVLHGYVVDQAAFVGVLERLRQAGMRIWDVSANSVCQEVGCAQISVAGRAGVLIRRVLDDAVVTEAGPTTTVRVAMEFDDLFGVIDRLTDIGLELRRVHCGRSPVTLPDPTD